MGNKPGTDRVFIVPGDKKPVLESIVTPRNKDLVWVVGNISF
jgi:hypothetical protein